MDFDYSQLSPGIRKLVKLLHTWGYETTDSGDGTNHKEGMGCALPYPMVAIKLGEEEGGDLVSKALSLENLLKGEGVPMGQLWVGNGTSPIPKSVDASYSTADRLNLLFVVGVADVDLSSPVK